MTGIIAPPVTCRKTFDFDILVRFLISRLTLTFFGPELFFLILAHPVYKMLIIQEPDTLEL